MLTSRPTPQPLRLGILAAANIAKQFSRDVASSPMVRIDAVASRNADNAAAFAAANGIARHHGRYVFTPPAAHLWHWSRRACCGPEA